MGKRLEQALHENRYAKKHMKKLLNILSHQGNENESCNEIPLLIAPNVKNVEQQNSHTLLMGM